MRAKILITPRSLTKSGHPLLERLSTAGHQVTFCKPGVQPSEDELLQLLPGCTGYLAGVEKVSARVMEAANGLKVISRNGVGIDNVDLQAASRLGIKVCATPGANARGVAELAIGLMMAMARSIPFSDAALKGQRWERREGLELDGKVLGLIGGGRIGRYVARMAAGMDMSVLCYDVQQDASSGLKYVSMDELLCSSDVISLHCPATSSKPIIDAVAINRMKQGAYIVNTARAGLIDAPAALAALDSGKLSGLATDVFSTEPPGDDPLVNHSRVIATPHIGGYTVQSVDRAVAAAIDNLLAALQA